MTDTAFKAIVVTEENSGQFTQRIQPQRIADLPKGDVLVRVLYSSLNYKDALSATGHKGVTRTYPHTPGIDAAGIVEHSQVAAFHPGDEVIITGYDLGMNTSGGFGQYISVPAGWVVKRPHGLTLREAMIYGTAGFTAALSLMRLEQNGLRPEKGEVLVTGATGGVGSVAVALLARAGYDVVAASGKSDAVSYLKSLGAKSVVARDEVDDTSSKPLLPERWAGVLDTVGGNFVTTAVRSVKWRGSVTTCGVVADSRLTLTVYPFILRGVNLLGIDSAQTPLDDKQHIWENLAGDWKLACLDTIAVDCSLDQVSSLVDLMLKGQLRGRQVIHLFDKESPQSI